MPITHKIAAVGGGETPCPRRREIAADRRREGRCSPAGGLPGSPGGDAVPTAEGKRGQDTKYGFLSPLDSPYLPLRCDSLRSRSEMRGAHSDVWCSKGTPLMEAELFAAERGRPAPSGRALLCAANHASEIQGNSATYKRKDARNRAPGTPRLDARPKGVASEGGFGGVKRGQGNHTVPLPPFSPAVGTALPAGEHRHPRPLCLFFLRRLCFPLFAVKIEGSLFLYTNDERIEEAVL